MKLTFSLHFGENNLSCFGPYCILLKVMNDIFCNGMWLVSFLERYCNLLWKHPISFPLKPYLQMQFVRLSLRSD